MEEGRGKTTLLSTAGSLVKKKKRENCLSIVLCWLHSCLEFFRVVFVVTIFLLTLTSRLAKRKICCVFVVVVEKSESYVSKVLFVSFCSQPKKITIGS